jgi:hypothetical protein
MLSVSTDSVTFDHELKFDDRNLIPESKTTEASSARM